MDRVCPDCLARVYSAETPACGHCGYARPSDALGGWMPDPLTGLIINGRYRLESRLGAGGMACVFRAARLGSLGGHVAVKILAPRFARTVVAKRFEREAMVISRLTNPHSVRVYDFETFELDGCPQPLFYIAMELVQGQTLTDLLDAQGRVNYLWGVDVLRQIARALEEAHALGIVHRDLKPSNVMIVQQRGATHVKVLDFGIAGLTSGDTPSEEKLTSVGVISGTPEYMSPEQANPSAGIGPASDIYTLGLIAFEMFTGQRPFEAPTGLEILVRRLSNPPPDLLTACADPGFPPQLAAVVQRMLATAPEDRYPDAGAVLDALAPFPATHTSPDFVPPEELTRRFPTGLQEAPTGLRPAAPSTASVVDVAVSPAPSPQGPKRGATWLWLGLGLGLAGGAVALILILTGDSPRDPTVASASPAPVAEHPTPELPPESTAAPQAEPEIERPRLETALAILLEDLGVLCRVDAPVEHPPLFAPLPVDLHLESQGQGVAVKLAAVSLQLASDSAPLGPVTVHPGGPPGRVRLTLPPRPMPVTYLLVVDIEAESGRRLAFSLAYDASAGTFERAGR